MGKKKTEEQKNEEFLSYLLQKYKLPWSTDFKRMKELLDEGLSLVCMTRSNYKFSYAVGVENHYILGDVAYHKEIFYNSEGEIITGGFDNSIKSVIRRYGNIAFVDPTAIQKQ